VPGEPTYFRTVVTSVANAGNYVQLVQTIEDVSTFANQQVTVSFWAKQMQAKTIAVELWDKGLDRVDLPRQCLFWQSLKLLLAHRGKRLQ
jgi:hypothetical protein